SHISALVLTAPAGIEIFTDEEVTALNTWTKNNWKDSPAKGWAAEQLKSNFLYFANLGVFTPKLAKYTDSENANNFREVVLGSVSGMLAEPVRNFLPQLRMPVCVLIGATDLAVPNRILHPKLTQQSILDDAEKLVANVRTLLVQNAGHFLPFEQPEVVANEIIKLIRKSGNTQSYE
ncbi:MAG: alpha/beta fold hydrolase, partial [Bacteroidia bacterium]